MTQVVTVPTAFTSVSEMARGLVGRVDDSRVILPGPEPAPSGEWVRFEVLLSDGQAGLSGVGQCISVVDNGEGAPAVYRYDMVFNALQFDPATEQTYAEILQLMQGGQGDQAEQADGQAAEAASPHAQAEQPAADSAVDLTDVSEQDVADQHTHVERVSVSELSSVDEDQIETLNPGPLDDAVTEPPSDMLAVQGMHQDASQQVVEVYGDQPEAVQEQVIQEATTAESTEANSTQFDFDDTQGLVFPSQPPRPALAASAHVTRAPHPHRRHEAQTSTEVEAEPSSVTPPESAQAHGSTTNGVPAEPPAGIEGVQDAREETVDEVDALDAIEALEAHQEDLEANEGALQTAEEDLGSHNGASNGEPVGEEPPASSGAEPATALDSQQPVQG